MFDITLPLPTGLVDVVLCFSGMIETIFYKLFLFKVACFILSVEMSKVNKCGCFCITVVSLL
jgi:hypothetical protein